MTAMADVYRGRRGWLVVPKLQTTAGVWLTSEEIATLPVRADAEELGLSVQQALKKSRSGVPHPTPEEWPAITARVPRAAGSRSWADFLRGTASISVTGDASAVLLVRMEQTGRSAMREDPAGSQVLKAEVGPRRLGEAIVALTDTNREPGNDKPSNTVGRKRGSDGV
jgi:hypothetical protein